MWKLKVLRRLGLVLLPVHDMVSFIYCLFSTKITNFFNPKAAVACEHLMKRTTKSSEINFQIIRYIQFDLAVNITASTIIIICYAFVCWRVRQVQSKVGDLSQRSLVTICVTGAKGLKEPARAEDLSAGKLFFEIEHPEIKFRSVWCVVCTSSTLPRGIGYRTWPRRGIHFSANKSYFAHLSECVSLNLEIHLIFQRNSAPSDRYIKKIYL